MVTPFIAGLPKAELHMHLEGSLEPETIMSMAERNGISLPYGSAAEMRAAFRFTDLQSFLDLFYVGLTVLRTEADFHEMTRAYLRRAAADNVRHAEVFLGLQGHTKRGIDIGVAVEGVLRAFEEARDEHGITGGLIASIQRQYDEADGQAMIAALRPWRDRIIGLGMGGPERGNPPSKFQRAFAAARHEYGWRLTVHAGEEAGAEYVREALDLLHVERIDHGVRCEEDEGLTCRLAEEGVPLTVCPCSNIMLRVFPQMSAHNIRRLHAAGLCITVNSDDPSYFGGYVSDNYAAIQTALDLSDEDLRALARNGFRSAFIDEALRARYLREVESFQP